MSLGRNDDDLVHGTTNNLGFQLLVNTQVVFEECSRFLSFLSQPAVS